MATLEQARAAKRALRERLLGVCGVTGLGVTPADDARHAGDVGEDQSWCVQVGVVSADVEVPADVDGVPVRVRVTGRISAS
ncbi:hypothetical protein [Georgenia deserti]|uniref:Uncharacterized protein n=1 Tax=Georgenia deserti TaxID=2093781 RepID=A0ABW4L6S2_9MICO